MTLAPDFTSDELALINRIVEVALADAGAGPPIRESLVLVQAAAQVAGVTMAMLSHGSPRGSDTHRLERMADQAFEQARTQTFLHAFAELQGGRAVTALA